MVGEPRRLDPAGIGYALAAYGFWGLVPIYFKAVGHVPSLEVLAHRVIWSVVLLAIWTQLRGTWDATLVILRKREARRCHPEEARSATKHPPTGAWL